MHLLNHQTIGGVLSVCLGLALWFWLIPHWVEPDPDLRLPVGLVPQILAVGFVLCGLAAIIQSAFAARKSPETDLGLEPGEIQGFLFVIALLLITTIGFQYLHFLFVAPALIAVAMWMYGALRPVSLILTSVLGPLAIWFIGTEILGRVLP